MDNVDIMMPLPVCTLQYLYRLDILSSERVIHWRYNLSTDISLKVDESSTLKVVRSFQAGGKTLELRRPEVFN